MWRADRCRPTLPARCAGWPRTSCCCTRVRLWESERRAVPYAAGKAARRLGLRKQAVVSALRDLVAAGWLTYEGDDEARGKPNGTRTYLPGVGQ
jgi:predicted ArsR family transcriptional regulator